MNNQVVTINLIPDYSVPAIVRLSQYDVERPIVFRVLDGNVPATFPSGATATCVGTKPSGLGFQVLGTIGLGGTVTFSTFLGMTQESGMIPAEIRFTTNEYAGHPATDIGTANFILAIEPSPHAEGTTDGTQETMANLETRLQGQIDELDGRIDAIEGDQSIIDDIDALDARVTALEQGGSGLTQAEKQLILTLFCKAAYAEDDAGVVYDALEALWATTTRTVTYNLSHVTSSNTAASVEGGSRYTTTLTATGNYTLNSVTVMMGGVDVTASYYNSGTITIPSVTGNIVITATAVLAAQSITATYTQSGTVYDTDSLDSLKADLVVTANYAGGTSETVTDYTLSGTLTEGTSTITVNYAGLTDTFTVTVTHAILPLYNWDLTSSLTDTVSGITAEGTATQSSSGLSFTARDQYMDFGAIYALDRTYEIDVVNHTQNGNGGTNNYGRLFMVDTDSNTASGGSGFLYTGSKRAANTSGYGFYVGSAWDSEILSTIGTADSSNNYNDAFFDWKTIRLYVSSSGKCTVAYKTIGADDSSYVTLGTSAGSFATYTNGHIYIGSSGSGSDYLFNTTISGLRVYEGQV